MSVELVLALFVPGLVAMVGGGRGGLPAER